MSGTKWKVRVRMYSIGFGDCFLVTFRGREEAHVLVDFGAHGGNHRGMDEIAADIRAACGGRLDVVVATHAHRDHVDGFRNREWWSGIKVGAVWLPWTEDPKDPKARELRGGVRKLFEGLVDRSRRFRGLDARGDDGSVFRGAAFDLWNAAAAANTGAMDNLRACLGSKGIKPSYLRLGAKVNAGIPGLRVDVLGPPAEAAALTRLKPPPEQDWPLAFRGAGAQPSFAASGEPVIDARFALPDVYSLPWSVDVPRDEPDHAEWRKEVDAFRVRLRDAAIDESGLAARLDSAINNTSLVLLLEFKGLRLLFPGDAQWGSWEGWLSQPVAQRTRELDFLKLSHHGSHNGTPQSAVDLMVDHGVRTMVSTAEGVHNRVPRPSLLKAIEHRTGLPVVRSDFAASARAQLPDGYAAENHWIDCLL